MNYEILKLSERELQDKFIKYCDHVYDFWNFIYKNIKKSTFTQELLDEALLFEEKSNSLEAQIQDDCVWSISKNAPLANHLRYIISIIHSIRDLERMSDYALSSFKFFYKNKVPNDVTNLIVSIMKEAIAGMSKVYESIKINPAIETYKICQDAHEAFKKHYVEMLKGLSSILKKKSTGEIASLFQGAIIVIKHIERLMDHLENIAENFMFIKRPDLFLEKRGKLF